MTCLVTGASGFIGRALCVRLLADGVELIATSRSGSVLDGGLQTRAMDPLLPKAALLRGVSSVVHLAGVAHQHADVGKYNRVNVEATLALAEAAAAAGVKQFIYFSSVKAMGPPQDTHARTESELTLPVDAYGRSKREAELQLATLCAEREMSLVVLRPCLVYGPEARANLHLLARLARWRALRPPVGGRRSMVGLQDLVALVSLLVQQPPGGSHTWIVTDDRPCTARQMYDGFREVQGLRSGWQCLPRPLWRVACRMVDGVRGEAAGSTAQKLFGNEMYDGSAVREATGWMPDQAFSDALSAMVPGR